MLSAVGRYLVRQVLVRWRDIVSSSEFLLALVAGVLFAFLPSSAQIAQTTLGDLATGVLAYAAVAFGFCLAGMTVALTLPDREFARRLAKPRTPETQTNSKLSPDAYSDLLFIFSWTATAHWLVVITFFATILGCGIDRALVPPDPSIGVKAGNGLLGFVFTYAVMLFLVTMLTLSQVGQTYIRDLRDRPGPSEQDDGPPPT